MGSRPAKVREKYDFRQMHTCLGRGAQMLLRQVEGIWIQLLFYYLVLVNVAASFRGKKFFHLWVRFYVV